MSPPSLRMVWASTTPVPRSGDDDTFEVLNTAIAELGLRRGLWMGDDRVLLHLVASLIEQAERCLPVLVALALDSDDVSGGWAEIARLLGLSGEGQPGFVSIRARPWRIVGGCGTRTASEGRYWGGCGRGHRLSPIG